MPLAPHTRLGPYEIVSAIGAGGMGEVYRARDTRLVRDVALKVLPSQVADDESYRSRFEQEARAAGALNHANIAMVYDVGHESGTHFIVSEFVEGESLRSLINRSPLPIRKTIDYATQLAEGIAVAHFAGIIHRDLKPENVLITAPGSRSPGRVKIVDFGIARHISSLPDSTETVTVHTKAGMVMGTVGYMSPEQVHGRAADARSDIFSFGSILYEMLSGTAAFEGASAAAMMSAILRDEPADLPASVPAGLQQIVRHCLEKEPSQRFQSAQDIAFALESLSGTSSELVACSKTQPPRTMRFFWPTVVLAAISLTLAVWISLQPVAIDLSRYRYMPFVTAEQPASQAAWSRDGRSIAFVMEVKHTPQVFVRTLDSSIPVQITRIADGATAPFWSPDGGTIYFLSKDRVWTVARAGGDPEPLTRRADGWREGVRAADISPDGKTLALWRATEENHVLKTCVWLSSPPGAEPRKYSPADFEVRGTYVAPFLHFAPDGSKILAIFFGNPQGEETAAAWLLLSPTAPRHAGSRDGYLILRSNERMRQVLLAGCRTVEGL